MPSLLNKIRQKWFRTSGKIERCHEAIAFAEAGETEHARCIMDEQKKGQASKKLLVMGRESVFSQEIIDYAIEMAQRMSYDILALNTAPLSCDTFKMLHFSTRVCDNFKRQSEENAAKFKKAARENNISLEHVVLFEESEAALKSIVRKNKDIAFVISETIEDRPESKAATGNQLQPNLYVYAMV